MTFYVFHAWIEPSETADTVLVPFGPWWDGTAASGAAIPVFMHHYTKNIG